MALNIQQDPVGFLVFFGLFMSTRPRNRKKFLDEFFDMSAPNAQIRIASVFFLLSTVMKFDT